jgi:dephospho-CoA kinase
MPAVAFAGRIGVGKSAISSLLASKLGWKRTSFGNYIRSVAGERGDEPVREVLQRIGEELVANDPEGLCRSVLKTVEWKSGEPIIIDGIRHLRILSILRELVQPQPLCFIYLDAQEEIRKERLADRKNGDLASLASIDAHSTERDVQTCLQVEADFCFASETLHEHEMVERMSDMIHARYMTPT